MHLRKLIAPSLLALTAATFAIPMAAHAQYDNRAYDGYCYARKSNAGKNGAVVGAVAGAVIGSQISKNERGLGTVGGAVIGGVIGNQVGKSSVKCYNGAYYAYRSGNYYSPPAAPDGYETIYFRDRPQSGYYENVYYDPPSYQQSYNQQPQYEDRYDNGPRPYNGQYSQPYNQPQTYEAQPYQPRYSNSADGYYSSSSTYSSSSAGSGQTYTDGTPYYGSSSSSYGTPRPRNAEEGWRDDQGVWHNGRPRAVGWQDDQGRWHVGQVIAYGWRDGNGGWHEESAGYSSTTTYYNDGY